METPRVKVTFGPEMRAMIYREVKARCVFLVDEMLRAEAETESNPIVARRLREIAAQFMEMGLPPEERES